MPPEALKTRMTDGADVHELRLDMRLRVNRTVAVLILVSALGLFTLLSGAHIQQPIAQDDLWNMVAAETYYETGIPQKYDTQKRMGTEHPELYLQMLVLSFRLFGASEVSARLPGIVSGWLAIILVFLVTNSMARGDRIERFRWASAASFLYALTPGLIQGVLILGIDNTILIPCVIFLCWMFVRHQQEEKRQWAILAGLTVAIALWARVTTSLVVVAMLCVYACFGRNGLKTKLTGICALFAGIALFFVTWYAYCLALNVPFEGPFTYTQQTFMDKVNDWSASQIALNALFFTLWVGLFPLVLLGIALVRRGRVFLRETKIFPEDAFLLCGLSLGMGYLFIGGAIFGYPKYQAPAVPLLYIFSGVMLSRAHSGSATSVGKQKLIAPALVIVAGFIQIFTMGDWIYVFRYQVREALAFMSSAYPVIWKGIAISAALFFVAYGLLFALARRFSWKPCALFYVFSLGSCLGVSFLQYAAAYQTGYGYGGRGTVEVAEYVRTRVPAKRLAIVPNEVNYYLKHSHSPYWHNSLWTDQARLVRLLADQTTSGFAYSIATNTVSQIQTILGSQAIQNLLQHDYERKTIGTYSVWIRK
jgi:4-amino-4-deoxy-L-arabinose transferase-like glycosyltransferase